MVTGDEQRAGDAADAADHPADPLRGYPITAPALRGPVLFDQHWLDLTFLHWPVVPSTVASLLPAGTRPDVWHDGFTYVGLVPFRMAGAGFGRHHPTPYLGDFLEWNVRLYSVDDAGRHGVVFRTLDATRLAVVAAAWFGFGLPYRWARIEATGTGTARTARDSAEVDAGGQVVTWVARRRGTRRPRSQVRLRVGDVVTPTPLETFLIARWGLHTRRLGRTWWIANEHAPWPVRTAVVEQLDDDLVPAAGVTPAGRMLRPLVSGGVYTRFALPRPVARATRTG